MTTPSRPLRRIRPLSCKPVDPDELFEAWKALPGSQEGHSVISALRIAKDRPEACGKLLAILARISLMHRARTLAAALDKLVEMHADSDRPYIEKYLRTEDRATRRSTSTKANGERRKRCWSTLERSHPIYAYRITSYCP